MALYVDEGAGDNDDDDDKSYLTFVDWNTLVKLPANVAFKGDNGKYLATIVQDLIFMSDDPNIAGSSFVVELQPDGHIQVSYRGLPGYYWSVDLVADVWPISLDTSDRNKFWPIKIDENSIAIRSAYNNNFCCHFTGKSEQDGLGASATTITKEAILQVQESVLERKIYNVAYQMEYARIFDEAPFLAGSTTLVNDKEEEGSIAVSIGYQDERSYTFSRSVSLTAGITTSIEAGLPFIEKATITVNYQINGTFQWDNTTTTTTSVTATGAVPVPGKSSAIVDYIGTQGSCNVPYTYTQQDVNSTTGEIIYTDVTDGIYTGVNYYNFYFHVRDTQPL
ncbi:hypothetical protein AAHA92_19434 [Salvia divinorum]|uniref:Agglutinin domain-containing protein n=1 Tax=Salvia divinorum TaxID=28513 RepID=A0ABD1H840_SALDI